MRLSLMWGARFLELMLGLLLEEGIPVGGFAGL
jgi:hypothetical protein